MNNATHWTERSTKDFLYSVASDFVEQIQRRMKTLDMKPAQLARESKVSKGRISQIFKDPSNISLETMIKCARALGLKLLVSAYEDVDDPNNERGPLNGEIVNILWERAGRPFDMWDIRELPQMARTGDTLRLPDPDLCWSIYRYPGRGYSGSPLLQEGLLNKKANDEKLTINNLELKGVVAHG